MKIFQEVILINVNVGLVYSGAYSSTLEGASASFQFLGQNVNITAKNGTTHWVYV